MTRKSERRDVHELPPPEAWKSVPALVLFELSLYAPAPSPPPGNPLLFTSDGPSYDDCPGPEPADDPNVSSRR